LVAGVEDAVVTEVVVIVEAEGVCGADVREIPSQSSIYARANLRVKEAVFSRAVAVADAVGQVVEAGAAQTKWRAAAPGVARR
jgi:threonine dehydrogenase-like Zn-dependent dehydrogenase